MRKLASVRVSYWDNFLSSYRVYMMTRSFHISLFEGTLHVDKIHVWFKIANITHALPVPVYRQTDFTPKRVVISPLHDTLARFRTGVKFNSRPGTTTGVNSRRGDPRRHDILWWYLVNKYRAMGRLSCSDRASGEVSRSTCFAWMDLHHIINSRGKKNDWHMLCRERHEISLTVLLVNCHDVTGRILDRWILRQTVMEVLQNGITKPSPLATSWTLS